MGPLLAIFVVISLNMAPDGAQTVTLDSYVVEGVGISADATRFLLTRMDEGRWLLHDAQGRPWYTVEVVGPVGEHERRGARRRERDARRDARGRGALVGDRGDASAGRRPQGRPRWRETAATPAPVGDRAHAAPPS